MDKKKFIKGFALGILCTVVAGGCIFGGLWYRNQKTMFNDTTANKLETLEDLVDQKFLEKADKTNQEEYLYKGLIAGLSDPYSAYYTKEEFDSLMEETEGEYKGIGVALQQNASTGISTIIKCYEGQPGANAGLLPGDNLYKVNGEEILDEELSEIVKKIKSSEKDTVQLTVAREGESDYLEFEVTLANVQIPSVEHELMGDKIGYLSINEFTEVTPDQFKTAYEDLKSQGMERLVVDLRNNPGGALDAVCDVLKEILPKGLIVYTEDKYGNKEEISCEGDKQIQIPLVVLVNGNSASASEIFAGAVQDYGIGRLVGTTTYGKGIVQQLFPLTDGSAVKLTVSKYYTPKGRNIHGTGIAPDVEVELKEELKQKATIEKAEDNQLQTAIETVKEMDSNGS